MCENARLSPVVPHGEAQGESCVDQDAPAPLCWLAALAALCSPLIITENRSPYDRSS